jgi:DNA-binding NarL/FixJ family response regulator
MDRAAWSGMGQPSKTVLIVDDSAAIRQELREEFALHGFTVCAEAENGRHAIEQARNNHPQLVILDLSMPVMNGLDCAPELRELLPNTPIILYTAFADALSSLDIRASGVTTTLAKSEPLAALIAVAEKLLQA